MRSRVLKSALGVIAACGLVASAFSAPRAASARPTVLPGFAQTTYATGINNSTAMAFAPDGRLFVAEQGGNLRVIKNGVTQATPFVTLPVDSNGERGLLGIAFDPNFATNGYVYTYHTVPGALGGAAHNQVTRFTANGDVVVPASGVNLFDVDNLSGATNHNGGAIHFGADGKLYIGVGENANPANSQTLNTTLGKILRINADGSIPTDNPFFSSTTGNNRAIYALGLRNPFTFGIQPGTGLTYINDVGQSTWEEINVLKAGANYGWSTTEGAFDQTAFPSFTEPLITYGHGGGTDLGNAITGGAFYNPINNRFGVAYTGNYFYGDYVNGWIRMAGAGTSSTSLFASNLGNISDVQVGDDGALYYASRSSGTIGRIASTAVVVPEPSALVLLAAPAALFCLASRGRQQNRRRLRKELA